ncbi:MAG: UDP-3-O-(3-hydroxymyristoyl)glucosamine N-acyltransferase [Armatimonadetes bacterium]|nr:UDP-3-O-(3-hydroxymyristoyl)glucosamine N-acyltransferase [Armatimonadota bacterium]
MDGRQGWTLEELGRLLGAEPRGSTGTLFLRPVSAGEGDPLGVTFAESPTYLERALATDVGAIIVERSAPDFDRPALLSDSPRLAFFHLLSLCDRPLRGREGVHPTAIVHESASVASTARIGAYAVVEEDAVIEDGADVLPHSFIGPRCRVGKGSKVLPCAVLVQDVSIGERCIVHSGAVLGTDGFGFASDGTRRIKVPQVGRVEVADDVEVGANTTVDRATAGSTTLADGVKIDNLVQIGHNSHIGENSVLAGQVGVSGSVTIGKNVVVGGQVAFADHVRCGDDILLAGRSGLMGDLEGPGEFFGVPPRPIKEALRLMATQAKVPELMNRIRALEREVERLKSGG